MAKYITQLRRGTKQEWINYESQSDHLKPLEGELVLEFDNCIPRIKIGDGIHEFSELEYMSVDSFIIPKPATITLNSENWIKDSEDKYHQVVTISNGTVTVNSKIDLQPSPEQLCAFHDADVTFTAVNENGVVTVYTVGTLPTDDYTIQVTITEVGVNV